MEPPPRNLIFVFLTLALWVFASATSFAQEEALNALNQQIFKLAQDGKFKEAIPIAEKALEVSERVHGLEDPNTADSLDNLGWLFLGLQNFGQAESFFEQALSIQQKILPADDPMVATTLNDLAVLYQEEGQYDKAISDYLHALQIWQKAGPPENPKIATCINNLAELYWAMGDYAEAESDYQEAFRIRQKVLAPDDPGIAQSLISLATLHRIMGRYAEAEREYLKALAIRQKVLPAENPDIAAGLFNLAVLYGQTGRNPEAESLYQQALRIFQRAYPPEHPPIAHCFNNLADVAQQIGKYEKAESLYNKALQIYEKDPNPDNPEKVMTLFNLSALYQDAGQYTKAERIAKEALRIREAVFGPENNYTAVSLERLAFLEFDLGRTDEATALARQSSMARQKMLSKVFAFSTEQDRMTYLDEIHPYSLFPFLKGTETDLAAAVLHYKGVILDSIVEDRQLAEASKDGQYSELLKQFYLAKKQLGQRLLQPLSTSTDQPVQALQEREEEIESQLAQHFYRLGQTRGALQVSLEQVQRAIPEDSALIEYLHYWKYLGNQQGEQRYGAIVLFSTGAPLWIPLAKSNQIANLVRQYGALVRGRMQDEELSENLQALYDAVCAPIVRVLPNQTQRIIISPDGQLNFVSFATLLTDDNQFLAQRYIVQYVATGRDLLRATNPSTAKKVILFADPDFDLAPKTASPMAKDSPSVDPSPSPLIPDRNGIEELTFTPLAKTDLESDELTKKFAEYGWATTPFTKERATKEALLQIHSPYILHLATHGFFAKRDPNQIKLGPLSKESQSIAQSAFFENPMHRSGLALTGAQTTIETWKRNRAVPLENDGIITAEDVSMLDLKNTWLVTLSACDTGSGEARDGEGVLGLRRGFVEAGTQNLLLTLWSISDSNSTIEFMKDFYEATHNSRNAPKALAQVQRDWLLKLRKDHGLTRAVNLAGAFIMTSQGKL
jgi:CHAT domain-containing protein/Tfp pilus assembly protein PilF